MAKVLASWLRERGVPARQEQEGPNGALGAGGRPRTSPTWARGGGAPCLARRNLNRLRRWGRAWAWSRACSGRNARSTRAIRGRAWRQRR
eukprot:5541216-Alexandrium_andersonii.AAC.1